MSFVGSPNNTTVVAPPSRIRHAGRASVRGKIRRVWRPRYMELLDVGHVKYYEEVVDTISGGGVSWEEDLSLGTRTSLNSSNSNHHSSSHRRRQYKYRLQILHARILDGTTLRDLHVGIPRGMYGWVFRARRLVLMPSESDNVNERTQQQQQQREVWTVDALKEERDFFCAVPRLEEAQMWVVALQWAAAVVARRPLLEEDWEHASRPDDDDVDDDATDDDSASLVSHPSLPPRPPPLTTAIATTTTTTTTTPSTPTSQRTHTSTRIPPCRPVKAGTNVVTKVTGWQVVRTDTLKWSLACRIQVLLCRNNNSGSHAIPSTKNGSQSWVIFRTSTEVHELVSRLQRDPHIPLFPVTVPDARKSNDYVHLYTWLDWFLRKLVMDAAWLNTTAVKHFLGLGVIKNDSPIDDTVDKSNNILVSVLRTVQPWMQMHSLHRVHQVQQRPAMHAATTPELMVKEWLADRPSPHPPAAWIHALLPNLSSSSSSSPSLWVAAVAGGGTLCMCWWWWGRDARCDEFSPYASVASTGFYIPRLTLRLDVLVVSWVGAAYLGSLAWPRPVATTAATNTRTTTAATSVKAKSRHRLEENSDDDAIANSSIETSDELDDDSFGEPEPEVHEEPTLSSPLPKYPANDSLSCWSQPASNIFFVRSSTYLQDKIKEPSGPAPLTCRGVDVWMTDNPERHIARHPAVLGGKLPEEDTFLVNFLLPFGNFVAYFAIPPLSQFPPKLRNVWTKFLAGDQQYRDARLKLLPVVAEGPWIVKAAVGSGKSPALLGKAIPLQYFFDPGDERRKAVYEVDVIITASTIAKGILSVVKGHTKAVSIAFAFIIEAAEQADLPETVLCTFQVHSLHLEDCPILPPMPDDGDDANSLA